MKGGIEMDTKQLFNDLVNSEELKDVPLKHIGKVAIVVLRLIQGNKYVYKIGE